MTRRRTASISGAFLSIGLGGATAAFAATGGEGGHQGTWLSWLYSVRVGGRPLVASEAGMAFAWSLVAILALTTMAMLGTRRLSIVPRGPQAPLEMLVGALRGMLINVMGPRGVDFLPFIGSLFIYIAFMNLLGLVPGFMAPTSNLSITAGLAIVVFVTVHYHGVRESGVGYLKHFIEGVPLQFPYILLTPLVFAVHLVGEVVRPVTLALRLFGNMLAGHLVLLILIGLVVGLARRGIPLPVQLPNMALEIIVAIVQAMVFSLLAAVYIAGVLHHREAEE